MPFDQYLPGAAPASEELPDSSSSHEESLVIAPISSRNWPAIGLPRKLMKSITSDSQLNFLVAVNVVVMVTATFLSGVQFIDLYNLQSMASQVSELGLLAIGVMLAIIAGNGGIDLSGIALANMASVIAGTLTPQWISPDDAPMVYTAVFSGVCIAVGLCGGMLNGLLISRIGLTPILCTLGTQLLFTGITVVLSNGSAVRLPYVETMDTLGNGSVFGIPIGFAIFIAIALAIGGLLRFSPFGVRLYLMGTNLKAARYAGIAQSRMMFTTYVLCGLLASIAGIIIAARTSSAKWDYGSSYVLIAILIAVMAGVKPEGGYGRVICLVFSATALQILSSTLNFLDVSNFFRDCAWGLLLLLFLATSRVSIRSMVFKSAKKRSNSPSQPPPAA